MFVILLMHGLDLRYDGDDDVVVTSCPVLEDCFIDCPFGFIADENGCRTCQCHKPCQVRSLSSLRVV